MFKHDPTDTKPCPHMRTLVSALADGALSGIARWYTLRHIDGCAQCEKGLAVIRGMRERLRVVHAESGEERPLSSEQWAAVEAAWQHVEDKHPAA